MKIRNGFVSNSSSSSFLIAIKNDTIESKFKDLIKNVPYMPMSFMLTSVYEYIISYAEKFDIEQTIQEYSADELDYFECRERLKEIYESGEYNLYEVSVCSDDGDPISLALYRMNQHDVNYENNDSTIIVLNN